MPLASNDTAHGQAKPPEHADHLPYSAAAQLDAHLAEAGVGTVADIRKAHIELIANLVATRSAATAHNRHRALQQLSGGLSDMWAPGDRPA